MPKTASLQRDALIQLLDESYDRRAWHGPNLRGSLRGVEFDEAIWRPHDAKHNIWEIALHAAYWKYVVRRRLLGEKRGSFSLPGTNWFERPQGADARAWKRERKLLDQQHRALRETVLSLSDADLVKRKSGRWNFAGLVRSIALHDVYHAGQIQTLKRLYQLEVGS
ncbi:MAG: DinB family protein [Pirellulales bacterium]|nr:DinB family protein [Pirellulales bacterium]